MPISMLKMFTSVPGLLSIFILKRCCILLNAFSTSMEMSIFFSSVLLMWCIILTYFLMLNHRSILGITSASILVKVFYISIHKGHLSVIFFWCTYRLFWLFVPYYLYFMILYAIVTLRSTCFFCLASICTVLYLCILSS